MDFISSTRAAENRTRWKGTVVKSPVVPQRPHKVKSDRLVYGHQARINIFSQ